MTAQQGKHRCPIEPGYAMTDHRGFGQKYRHPARADASRRPARVVNAKKIFLRAFGGHYGSPSLTALPDRAHTGGSTEMRTSDARENWSGPVLLGASDGTTTETATPVPATANAHESSEHGQSIFLLTHYPDVGRVSEVAAVLQCSKWCVYDLINTGALKSIRLGRAIRVTRRALEEFLAG